jgi:hypothetical protein
MIACTAYISTLKAPVGAEQASVFSASMSEFFSGLMGLAQAC